VNRRLTVAFTKRATNQARRALAWWRENPRASPDLLEQELRSVLALLASTSCFEHPRRLLLA
jgi:hypothetical protein